jgi:hypothetical protein
MSTKTTHEILVQNARRALRNLSKDNSVSISEVCATLQDMRDYLEELFINVEEDQDAEWDSYNPQEEYRDRYDEDI